MNQLFDAPLDHIAISHLVEIAHTIAEVHRLHVVFGVACFMGHAQNRVTDVRSQDFNFPGRRNHGLGHRHFERQRMAKIVVGQSITNQHGDGVRFLSGGAPRAPNPQRKVAALLLALQQLFKNHLVKQIELRFVTEEAGLIDGQVFEQGGEFAFSFFALQQPVIAVEGIQAGGFKAALQPVLQKMDPAFVEKHAAFFIDECLQQLLLRFGELDRNDRGGHYLFVFPFNSPSCCESAPPACRQMRLPQAPATDLPQ